MSSNNLSKKVKSKNKIQPGESAGWHSLAIIINSDAQIKFVTKPLALLLGYSVSDLLGKNAIDLFVIKEEHEERKSQLNFLYKQESVIDAFDIKLLNKIGKALSMRFSIINLDSTGNNTEDIAFIGDDMAVSRKLVMSQFKPEAQLGELLSSAREFVIIIDNNEEIKSINESGETKLGIKSGMKLRDLLEPIQIKKTSSFLTSLSNISSTANINLVFLHPGTKQKIYLAGTVSSIVEASVMKEFRLILHDVTERVKTEKAKDLYYSIAHHSIHSENLEELYRNIHKELKAVVDCENMYIALKESDQESDILSFPYYQEGELQFKGGSKRIFGEGITEYIISKEEPQLFTKKDLLKLEKEKKIVLHGNVPEIWLGVPLKVKSEVIGVIAIQSYYSKSFYSSRDLKLLDFASSQIAMAIDMIRTQDKLKTQTAKLNSIIESGSHLIWTVNKELELTSFNKNYFDAIINNYDIIPSVKEGSSDDASRQLDSFWQGKYESAFSGVQENFEIKLKDKGGADIWKEIYLNPIYLDGGKIEEVSGIANDITEKKKSEIAIIEAKDLAEASLVVKEQFLANMSHEIRTPLNGIIGVIDLLELTDLAKEQESYLKTIKDSSETLLNILNDILDLSKIEAKKMRLRPAPVATKKLIVKLKSLFAPRAETHKIKLKFHLDKKIPKVILADEMRIIQVISNLVANSIKFTPPKGSIDIGIELVAEKNKDITIRVDVRDSGIGIKKEDIDKLFTNFTQLDASTTKSYGGTGLGLSISKQLVEMMGGEIGVYSNPGFGSTFWFSFVTKKTNREVKVVESHVSLKAGLRKFTNIVPHILVVDDNLVNREVAGQILKKCGCTIDLASNGIEAVFMAKKNDYDIIFMDIQMPDMDGIEANRQIKNLDKGKQPLVVAMTAYSLKEDEERFLEAGLDDYLAKPIRARQLIGKVEQLLIGVDLPEKNILQENVIIRVINQETLLQLEKYGGKEMVITALKEFDIEASSQLKECEVALNNKDFLTIRKLLHTLKGSAGTLGIEKVAVISEDLEAALKKKDYSGITNGLAELNNSFVEFRENFSNIISQ